MHAEISLIPYHPFTSTLRHCSLLFQSFPCPPTAISNVSVYAVTSCRRLAAATDRTEPESLLIAPLAMCMHNNLGLNIELRKKEKKTDHLPSVLGSCAFPDDTSLRLAAT